MSEALRRWLGIAVLALLALLIAVPSPPFALADSGARKVRTKVDPMYPDLAKRMHLGGIVKVEVTIAANGAVKSTRLIGGNPVLVDSALEAVKHWKFEPATDDTTQVVEFRFSPQ